MALYVKGDNVANATSYILKNRKENTLSTASSINFNLNELSLTEGVNALTVQATASGYTNSDNSNTVYALYKSLTPDEILTKKYFDPDNNGAIKDVTTSFHNIYVYKNLTAGSTIRVKGFAPQSNTMHIIAFYTSNDTFISYIDRTIIGYNTAYDKSIILPANCTTVKMLRYAPTSDNVVESYVYIAPTSITVFEPDNIEVGMLNPNKEWITSNSGNALCNYTNWGGNNTLYCAGYAQSSNYSVIRFLDSSGNIIQDSNSRDAFGYSVEYFDMPVTVPSGTAKIQLFYYYGLAEDVTNKAKAVPCYLYVKS